MARLTGVGRLVLKRLLLLIPLLLGLTILTFLLIRVGGSNPATLIVGPTAGDAEIAAVEEELGLDQPVLVQYGRYLQGALTGDLGESWVTGRPVVEELRERLPITLELVTTAMVAAAVVGTAIGFVSAMNHHGPADQVLRSYTLLGVSIPVFWLGLLLILVFFVFAGVAPAPTGRLDLFTPPAEPITHAPLLDSVLRGNWAAFSSILHHMMLPVIALSITSGSAIAKQTRALVLEVRSSPRVRYARACGLGRRQVWGVVLRNALPGIVTFVAIAYSLSLGGSALLELIFSWGGMGSFGINAITRADFAVVQAYVLSMGVIAAAVYLVSDLVVAAIDPRVTL